MEALKIEWVEMDEGGEPTTTKERQVNELQDDDATMKATTTGEGAARKDCWSRSRS